MLICPYSLKNQSPNRNWEKEKPFASLLSAQRIYSAAGAAEAQYDGALTHWSLLTSVRLLPVLSEYALHLNTFFTAFFLLFFLLWRSFLVNGFVRMSTVPLLDKAKY